MIEELTCKSGNNNIYGLLYKPENIKEKLPIVICSHGLYSSHRWFDYFAKSLISNDILAYTFDFCGGSPYSLSDGNVYDMTPLTECDDLNAVINEITKLNFVDKKHVYLLGHSQGAFVASMCADEKVRSLFLLAPAFNIPSEMKTVKLPEDSDIIEIISCRLAKKYVEDSITINLNEIFNKYKGKVFIFHGVNDKLVSLKHSINAEKKFSNAKLFSYDNEGHKFSEETNKLVYKTILNEIKGVTDND